MDEPYDPIVGLEEMRKYIYRLSKSAFYSKDGPAKRLPVVTLSARRKGVRRSAVDADLARAERGRWPAPPRPALATAAEAGPAPAGQAGHLDAPDPFDPARLRLDPAAELVGITDVPAETRGR